MINITKPIVLFGLAVMLLFLACQPAAKVYVRYRSSFDEILIEKGRLTYLRFRHHFPADQPYRATPDSISRELVVNRMAVSKRRQEDLLKQLTPEFLELPDTLGAPAGQRAYPSEIFVRWADGTEKKVVYRSHPGYGKEPAAFSQVRNFLILLAQEQKNLILP